MRKVVNIIWSSVSFVCCNRIFDLISFISNKICQIRWKNVVKNRFERRLLSLKIGLVSTLISLTLFLVGFGINRVAEWGVLSFLFLAFMVLLFFGFYSSTVFEWMSGDTFDLENDFRSGKISIEDCKKYYPILARRQKAGRIIREREKKRFDEEWKQKVELENELRKEFGYKTRDEILLGIKE